MARRTRGIRRDDYTEVWPTDDEKREYARKSGQEWPKFSGVLPRRAIHIPCGKRMWYTGLGIGSHDRACKGAAEVK